jgi:hypothetical protein
MIAATTNWNTPLRPVLRRNPDLDDQKMIAKRVGRPRSAARVAGMLPRARARAATMKEYTARIRLTVTISIIAAGGSVDALATLGEGDPLFGSRPKSGLSITMAGASNGCTV